MAKPKAKPKTKPSPKKKITVTTLMDEIKKINKRINKLEKDIQSLRENSKPLTPQSEKNKNEEIETRFDFVTSI